MIETQGPQISVRMILLNGTLSTNIYLGLSTRNDHDECARVVNAKDDTKQVMITSPCHSDHQGFPGSQLEEASDQR
jgi:hypothetical protein